MKLPVFSNKDLKKWILEAPLKSYLLLASLTFLTISADADSIDTDQDGIPDSIEGMADSDGDGVSNQFDNDSDGDGLTDAFEGDGDADQDGIANFLDLDADADGLEDNIEGGFDNYRFITVSDELIQSATIGLPEGRAVNANFLNPAYKTDLVLAENATIEVTFLNEGAGYRNCLGYYLYRPNTFDGLTKADVDLDGSGIVSLDELLALDGVQIGWVFPNASKAGGGGPLRAGDTVGLRNGLQFQRGTSIGFFLVQNAWLGGSIRQPNNEGTRPLVMYTTDFLNPEAVSDSGLSSDSSENRMRHVALMYADQNRDSILMGFEDLHRVNRLANDHRYRSDEDFNDAVFTIRSTPASALATSGLPTVISDEADNDGDGIPNSEELPTDTDGDGIANIDDPDDDGDGIVTPSEGTGDTDNDGQQNYLDTDSDNDGIDDSEEGARDSDFDGIPDFLDTDSDNDTIPDSVEGNNDSDGDGTPDRIDPDDDGDSVSTIDEGTEDFDGDGIADYLDTDSDNDQVSDGDEAIGDTDSDGIIDRYDTDDDNDGIPSSVEGSGDSDGDGISDQIDTDSDNDGFSDSFEGTIDSDSDGLADRIDSDDDNDGIPSVLEGDGDPDGDNIANYLDTDSDGDGILDTDDFVELKARTRVLQQNYSGKPLVAGDTIEYTITVTNNGQQAATEVTVHDIIPEYTSYVTDSLVVDGLDYEATLDSQTDLTIGALGGESSVSISVTVVVDEALPASLNKITSHVSISCLDSVFPAISDNDPSGHCGIQDDGFDSSIDAGIETDDDDPTILPLMQGVVYERCTLAFEDLQNAGWNDWDMNDLVLDIASYYTINDQQDVESVVVTFQLLARGAGMDSELNLTLPFVGYGEWQSLYISNTGALEDSTVGADIDEVTIQLWESSKDALPPYTALKYQWGAARTERFDPSLPGKIAVVNIYLDAPEQNPLDGFSLSPHDTWAYIPGTQQAIHRMEYNLASSQIVYEGPLFGRSLPFVVKFDSGFAWPAEGQAIWNSHPEYVPYIKSGGTTNQDWADTINIWRVWFDDEGLMNGRDEPNSAAFSDIYSDYVERYSN